MVRRGILLKLVEALVALSARRLETISNIIVSCTGGACASTVHAHPQRMSSGSMCAVLVCAHYERRGVKSRVAYFLFFIFYIYAFLGLCVYNVILELCF